MTQLNLNITPNASELVTQDRPDHQNRLSLFRNDKEKLESNFKLMMGLSLEAEKEQRFYSVFAFRKIQLG